MKSMTGFGTAEGKVGKGRLFVEIKTINHRFSEFNLKIPNRMGVLEARIRKFLSNHFLRGKVDVYFKERESLFGGAKIRINYRLAHEYHKNIKKLSKELGVGSDDHFFDIVGIDHFMSVEEEEGSYERLWGEIEKLLQRAAKTVVEMRNREGKHIYLDQKKRLALVSNLIKQVRMGSNRALDNHLERLKKKVQGTVDEQRLHAEVAYLGGRQDIAEELVRLESHIKQYIGLLNSKDPVGRQLDFLLQEINREINTVGAKAADAKIAQHVVDCKTELERLREQIQNVE